MTKKCILLGSMFPAALLAFVLSPALSQEKSPAPVSVVVRVLDGGQFVDGLALRDFELLENGVPQRIDALFKVDRNAVTRQEGEGPTLPVTARRFYLLFQMYEYNPKVSEALQYFFNNALLPGDTMEIQTTMRNYMLTPAAFAKRPKDVLAKEMDNIVKKDISQTNFIYKTLIKELRRMAGSIEGLSPVAGGDEESDVSDSVMGLEQLLIQYRESLGKLESLRMLDQDKIIGLLRRSRNRTAGNLSSYSTSRNSGRQSVLRCSTCSSTTTRTVNTSSMRFMISSRPLTRTFPSTSKRSSRHTAILRPTSTSSS